MDKAERMALVNTMAVQAKTDPSVMPELWKKVEGLIKVVCSRYCRSAKGDRLYDYEDLCQSAYFGVLKAVGTYDPERGRVLKPSDFLYTEYMCKRDWSV